MFSIPSPSNEKTLFLKEAEERKRERHAATTKKRTLWQAFQSAPERPRERSCIAWVCVLLWRESKTNHHLCVCTVVSFVFFIR